MSFRFDKGHAESLAGIVEKFLTVLGLNVATGKGYEPRSVSAKVRARLQGRDVLVILLDAQGDSTFCRDEINEARAAGIPVIPLVENGATFEPGFFADLEYIPFPTGQVAGGFISLLEGLLVTRGDQKAIETAKVKSSEDTLARAFSGLSREELAILYYCFSNNQRSVKAEIEDPDLALLRSRGLMSMPGGAIDPWRTASIMPTGAWEYMASNSESVFPKTLRNDKAFLRLVDTVTPRMRGESQRH